MPIPWGCPLGKQLQPASPGDFLLYRDQAHQDSQQGRYDGFCHILPDGVTLALGSSSRFFSPDLCQVGGGVHASTPLLDGEPQRGLLAAVLLIQTIRF